MSSDVEHWKDKYLDSLQRMEEQEAAWQTRFEMLRRSLTRTSMAAEGQDQRLDACLRELRTLLREEDCDDALNSLTPRLEKAMLDNEQRRQGRLTQIAQSLRLMAAQLREVPGARDLRRALKRFTKRLDERVGQLSELQLLLHELETLQRTALKQPETAPRPGFLQRLFGQQPVPAVQEAAPVLPVAPAHEPDDDEEDDEPDTAAPPASDAPPAPANEATAALETATAPATASARPLAAPAALATAPAPSLPLGNANPASPSSAALAEALLEPLEADNPFPAEPPPYSTVAERIELILLSLLEDLYLPEQWQSQVNSLRRRIKNGLNWYELIPVLDDLAALLRLLPLFNHQFEDYLQQLNERLAVMQDTLIKVQSDRSQQNQTAQAFDSSLREQVENLQDSVGQATDLSTLKQVVEERLDNLLRAIDSYQRQCQENEKQLGESLQQLGERLTGMESTAVELRSHLEEQQRKALFDTLTGLPNRAALNERLEQEIAHWQRQGDDLLLAIMDVDHFKRINDSYGHLAGDRVLKILAGRWQERVRSTDFLARYGGEEFVLILPSTSPALGIEVLDQLRTSIEDCPFHFKGEHLKITVSAGLAAFSPGINAEQVFEQADRALYRAKRSGRNRVEMGRLGDSEGTHHAWVTVED